MKVLVADDHGIVREGIKLTLGKLGDDLDIYEAASGDEVRQCLLANQDLGLVLLDLYMPQTDGFSLLSSICKTYPDLPVIVLSASEDVEHMRKAIDWGASGYIPKSVPERVMLEAIEMVLQGGVYVPQNMFTDTDSMGRGREGSRIKLTGRQEQVLSLLGEGKTNKEIANFLGLSEYTIKIHVTAILKLLEVNNRTQAVVEAKRLGLLPPDL